MNCTTVYALASLRRIEVVHLAVLALELVLVDHLAKCLRVVVMKGAVLWTMDKSIHLLVMMVLVMPVRSVSGDLRSKVVG